MPLDHLQNILIDPLIVPLPKADLHIHQEDIARLERVVAQRFHRLPYDPRPWVKQMMAETPAGMGRINSIYSPDTTHNFQGVKEDDPEIIIAKMTDAMIEEAVNGAVLVELRFGATSIAFARPDFMTLFRKAEERVQTQYPDFCAEAIVYIGIRDDLGYLQTVDHQLKACIQAARDGLAGVDFRVDPYDVEAGPAVWKTVYQMAEQVAEANLGLTIHAGEFSPANILSALRTPGIRRIGHAVYAASDPYILDELIRSGVTVECSLTCNVVLGAVSAYETHPIRRFVDNGVPVTLATDLPVHLATTIGREYAIAAELGFSISDLCEFTLNAIRASFQPDDNRKRLLKIVQLWAEKYIPTTSN